MSYYFSINDQLGQDSNVIINYNNHCNKKAHKQDYSWGADKHTKCLFPRGKCFVKLLDLQLEYSINLHINE